MPEQIIKGDQGSGETPAPVRILGLQRLQSMMDQLIDLAARLKR